MDEQEKELRMNFAMSSEIGLLAEALAKAQGSMKHAAKDNTNPHFNSRYADLASVLDACREPLSANGLSCSQLPAMDQDGVQLMTMLMHTSGQWIRTVLNVPLSKRDAQGVGSAITYARRYSLASIVGIAQDDDDGNAASRHQEKTEKPAPKRNQAEKTPPKPTTTEVLLSLRNSARGAADAKAIDDLTEKAKEHVNSLPEKAKAVATAYLSAMRMWKQGYQVDMNDEQKEAIKKIDSLEVKP